MAKKYKKFPIHPIFGDSGGIYIPETNTAVPTDPNNKDWQEYLEWLEEGNTPEEAD